MDRYPFVDIRALEPFRKILIYELAKTFVIAKANAVRYCHAANEFNFYVN
jgi:hypothetical protein